MTTICRVNFCPDCKRDERPKTMNLFLAYGSNRNDFVVYRADHIGNFGFTPHIIELLKINHPTGIVTYRSVCSMYGCGITREPKDGFYLYFIDQGRWKFGTMKLSDWNAWTQFKDTGYQI